MSFHRPVLALCCLLLLSCNESSKSTDPDGHSGVDSVGTDIGNLGELDGLESDLGFGQETESELVQSDAEPADIHEEEVQNPVVSSLSVKIEYVGTGTPDTFTLYLFGQEDGEPGCVGMDPLDPPFPAANSVVSMSNPALPFEVVGLNNLTPDNPLVFTALVLALAKDGSLVAWACDDQQVVAEYGEKKTVTIVVEDLPL